MLRQDGLYYNPSYNYRYGSVIRFLPDGFCLTRCVDPAWDLARVALDLDSQTGVGRYRVEGDRLEMVVRYCEADSRLRPGRVVYTGRVAGDQLETSSRSWLSQGFTHPTRHDERFTFVPRAFPAADLTTSLVARLGPSGEWRLNPLDAAELVRVGEGFWLYRTPVTVGQFRLVPGQFLPDPPRGGWKPDLPVVRITRDDALSYAAAVGGRLPTPREWARAGGASGGRRKAVPVGCGDFSPSGVGDLTSNVAEWCSVPGVVLGGQRPVPGPGLGFRVAFD